MYLPISPQWNGLMPPVVQLYTRADLGLRGCERRRLLSCKSVLLLKLHCIRVHKRCYSHITGGGVDALLHLWDMSRFPPFMKNVCLDLIWAWNSVVSGLLAFSILHQTGGVSSAFSSTFSPAWKIWPAQFWPEKWVRSFFLVSKTFSKENFCHD